MNKDLITEDVVRIFEKMIKRNVSGLDMYREEGREALKRKVGMFVSNGMPVDFVLPGFPCKSPNTKDKVLGELPDKAEEVAIDNIDRIVQEIQDVYPTGANFNVIVMD